MAQPKTGFEQNDNTSATYAETIAFYEALAAQYPRQLQLTTYGTTDSGFPIHEAVLSVDGDFDPVSLKEKGRCIIFVNNAIHPGEPCGVEASMLLLRDYLSKPELQGKLQHLVLVVIPFYNISGGLNRGANSRANQFGPEQYGFRGNAKNLDLNRDFIKCDSRNARTFNQIYNRWLPDIFIDNHTSNGADYQYTMTLIPTQHNKLHPVLAKYMQEHLLPRLFQDMKARKWEMTPYVYARETPDEGIAGFLDLPRYSSGYAALHHAISFIPETHMLKPFRDRVMSVYAFMDIMVQIAHEEGDRMVSLRKKAIAQCQQQKTFDLNWELDISKSDTIQFKGYEAGYKPSEISGLDRLYYDRNKPFTKKIPHYNYYKVTQSVEKPIAYIIPQAYQEVIERLRWNGVALQQLQEDFTPELEMYYIRNYETSKTPYEGHYLHSQVEVEKKTLSWNYHKGDYVVYANQPANRYVVETLEPQAADSYFAWNFFDGILMQKEYFSAYVFEDLASAILKEQPKLKKALEARKAKDPEFAKSARAQLDFIYQHSAYYEPTYQLYPVGRMLKDQALPVGK
ncbi:MAG: hypothetical protein DHS20C18_39160 [Saprospiraceae bacterium]|nr:MAG: hypothetical protein DHS20C18_39160 [Saprospiraceae bacterium]